MDSSLYIVLGLITAIAFVLIPVTFWRRKPWEIALSVSGTLLAGAILLNVLGMRGRLYSGPQHFWATLQPWVYSVPLYVGFVLFIVSLAMLRRSSRGPRVRKVHSPREHPSGESD